MHCIQNALGICRKLYLLPLTVWFVISAHTSFAENIYLLYTDSIHPMSDPFHIPLHGDALPIRMLRKKGYRVNRFADFELETILKILAHPDTTAVFYIAHGMVSADGKPTGTVTTTVGEKVVELSQSRVNRESPPGYKPNPELKLFYLSACYGSLCKQPIKKMLKLHEDTILTSDALDKVIYGPEMVRAIRGHTPDGFDLISWVKKLDKAAPSRAIDWRFENALSVARHSKMSGPRDFVDWLSILRPTTEAGQLRKESLALDWLNDFVASGPSVGQMKSFLESVFSSEGFERMLSVFDENVSGRKRLSLYSFNSGARKFANVIARRMRARRDDFVHNAGSTTLSRHYDSLIELHESNKGINLKTRAKWSLERLCEAPLLLFQGLRSSN